MYKDVARRILASILVICMIGTTPDFSLWAATTGGGTHTYANENDSGAEIYNTSSQTATIANVFTMDANTTGMSAQTVQSVSFALNRPNQYGNTGEYIKNADYTISILKDGTPLGSVSGTYEYSQSDGEGNFTVSLAGQNIEVGPDENITAQVDLSNAVWTNDAQQAVAKDTISYKVADLTAGSSTCGVSGKAACIRMTTAESSSATDTTAIEIKNAPAAIAVGDTPVKLELEYTPATASQKDVTWTSSNPDYATVGTDGTVVPLKAGATVEITATLQADSAITDSVTMYICKDMDNSDIIINAGNGIGNQIYTGEEIEVPIEVSDAATGTVLTKGTHYSDTDYDNNVNAGTATVTLNGIMEGYYLYDKKVDFTIEAADLSLSTIDSVNNNASYVLYSEDDVQAKKDSVLAADPSADVSGITVSSMMLDLVKEDLKAGYDAGITATAAGLQITYAPTGAAVQYLKLDRDYEITDSKLDKSGAGAYILIQGKGNYQGTKKISIPIKKGIGEVEINDADTIRRGVYTYTGKEIKPEIVVTDDDLTLTENRDYVITGYADDVAGTDLTNAGTKTVTIEGKGAYAGTDPVSGAALTTSWDYVIHPKTIDSPDVDIELPKQAAGFTDANIQLEITYNGMTLVKGTDYSVTVAANTDPSLSDVTITGLGNYKDSVTKTVDTGIDVNTLTMPTIAAQTYLCGKEIRPEFVLTDGAKTLKEGTDYTLKYSNNINVGTASIKVTGIGKYAGTKTVTFAIDPADISTWDVTDTSIFDYTKDVVFNVSMNGNTLKTDVYPDYLRITQKATTADGEEVTYRLKAGATRDYTFTYTDADKVGEATITVTGNKNFTGTATLKYVIGARDITEENLAVDNVVTVDLEEEPTFTGGILSADDVKVYVEHNGIKFSKDAANADVKKFFEDNFTIDVLATGTGNAMIIVTGKGNYAGMASISCAIKSYDLSNSDVKITLEDPKNAGTYLENITAEYTGKAIEPKVKVTLVSKSKELVQDVDYTVSYADNTEAGEATVIITGKGNYAGKNSTTFNLIKDIDNSTIELLAPIPQQYYTGAKIQIDPSDIVLIDKKADGSGNRVIDASQYQINYDTAGDYTNVGTHTIRLIGVGYYFGDKAVTFDIVPNSIANVEVEVGRIDNGTFKEQQNFRFTGSAIPVEVRVTYNGTVLKESTDGGVTGDYRVFGPFNNVDVSSTSDKKPYVIVQGINDYSGIGSSQGNIQTAYFNIWPRTLDEIDFGVTWPTDPIKPENGKYNPSVKITDTLRNSLGAAVTTGGTYGLKKGTDYTVTCVPTADDNGVLTVTGIGNYTGVLVHDVKIEKETITTDDVVVTFTSGQTFTYNAKSVLENPKFDLVVKDATTGTVLERGVDYDVIPASGYADTEFTNYSGRDVRFLIKFINSQYSGTLASDDYTFRIAQKSLEDNDVTMVVPNQEQGATGAMTPTPIVTYGDIQLVAGKDFTTTYANNTEADIAAGRTPSATIYAVAGGNYIGTRTENFSVAESLAAANVTGIEESYVYQGQGIEPIPTLVLDGRTLRQGRDYLVSYSNNINAYQVDADGKPIINTKNEDATVTITGMGEYAGTIVKKFRIDSKNLADSIGGTVSVPTRVTAEFTGSGVRPQLDIVYTNQKGGKYNLILNKDYHFIDAGSSVVDVNSSTDLQLEFYWNFMNVINGNAQYKKITCSITPKAFVDAELEENAGDIYVGFTEIRDTYSYEGADVRPAYMIRDIKRNADGSYREDGTLAGLNTAYELKAGTDYDIRWIENDRPGTAKMEVTGMGNYKDQKIVREFEITGTLDYAEVEFIEPEFPTNKSKYTYTGKKVHPKVKVSVGSAVLTGGRNASDPTADYWIEYDEDSINCGLNKKLVIHGINAYEDSADITRHYDIVQRDINDATVQTLGSFTYNGEIHHPTPTIYYGGVLLDPTYDYVCEWEEDIEVNDEYNPDYEVKITGTGNFYGERTETYKVGDSFSKEHIQIKFVNDKTNYDYTGETIVPEIIVKDKRKVDPLVRGVDYEIAIDEGNPEYINAGSKTFRVYGIKDNLYVGDMTANYTITPIDLSSKNPDIVIDREGLTKILYRYYGKEHILEPSVIWMKGANEVELSLDNGDFVYTYKNNLHAGTATVTVGEGIIQSGGDKPNFTGKRDLNFTIKPIEIEEDSELLSITDANDWVYTFNGKEIIPEATVEYDNLLLTKETDYTITSGYSAITEDAKATFKFKGDYTGTVTKQFAIRKRSINDVNYKFASGKTTYKYTGEILHPEIVLTDGSATLKEGTDYELYYDPEKNRNAGVGVIEVTGIGNYTDTREDITYVISPIDVSSTADVEVVVDSGVIRNGQPAEPEFSVYWIQEDGTKLKVYAEDDTEAVENGREIAYQYAYYNNATIGRDGTLQISGINNFTGTREVTFKIGSDINQFISGLSWTGVEPDLTFNNTIQTPPVNVMRTDDTNAGNLREGKDYEIVYEPVSESADATSTNAGEYKVYVKGINNYASRTEALSYTIKQRNLSNVDFKVEDVEFTGSAVKPQITAEDVALGLTLENVDAADAATTKKVNAYTTVTTGDLINVGAVSVAINALGKGNYTGSVTKEFHIVAKDIVNGNINITPAFIDDQIYSGAEIKPEIKIIDTSRTTVGESVSAGLGGYELTANDYTIAYENNVYPGTAKVTVKGKGNYAGTHTKEFNIVGDLAMAEIAPIPVQGYTGAEVRPALTVTLAGKTLALNGDYVVTYNNNINRGVATATITPATISKYVGEKTVTFEIGRSLANATIRTITDTYTYTGNAITPQVAVTFADTVLTEGIDYAITYSNNVNVGTAEITVVGRGVYEGTLKKSFQIVGKNISRCNFANIETKLYNKQATSQNLVVSDGGRILVAGQEYNVTYLNNTNPGTATITIQGLGNYSGYKTIRYNINVKPMTTVSVKSTTHNSVTITWPAVDGAGGYAIYNANNDLVAKTAATSYTHKKLTSLKTYVYKVRPYVVSDGATYYGDFNNTVKTVTNPKTPSSVKVKAQGGRKVKVSWKKVKGVTGYEVYRSTKKSSGYKKVKAIKKSSTVNYTNKNLKKNKKYYFKVRAYKTVNGNKIYSKYSSPKQVKVK